MAKTNLFIVLMFSALFTHSVFAQKGYYMEQRMQSSGTMGHPAKEQIQKTWLSDVAIRVEGSKTTTIFRFDKHIAWLLRPDKKEYMEITTEQMQAMAEMGMSMLKKDKNNQFTVQKTDETKTINKWKCYKVISESSTMKQSIWLTEDLPFGKEIYYKYFKHMPKLKELAELIYNNEDIKGFPVLTEMEMNVMGIQVKSSTELIKIHEERMNPALFELPSGYSKIAHPMLQMPPNHPPTKK